jgi:hypothetical protein
MTNINALAAELRAEAVSARKRARDTERRKVMLREEGYAAGLDAAADRLDALAREGWRPIAECPAHRVVLLLIPEHEGHPWTELPFPGMKNADGVFVIYAPYRQDGKGVVCPVEVVPRGWQPLPPPPKGDA